MKVVLSVSTKTVRTVERGEITNRQLREALGLPTTGEISIGGDLTLSDDDLGEVLIVERDVTDSVRTEPKKAARR
jgi:hypothetical protein